jgi:hypothetical protein
MPPGKPKHPCHASGWQGVQGCEPYLLSEAKRGLIDRLLVEWMSWRGLCRPVGVTRQWLLGILVQCVEVLPAPLHGPPVTCHGNVMLRGLEGEADARASCVQKQANQQWSWIAPDATSR